MLKQASVRQIRKEEITKRDGFIAITMRFYPRGLRKELRDEYRGDLAPSKELFRDFKRYQLSDGHEQGFLKSNYEERFQLSSEAEAHLAELAKRSRMQDVFLVCQCAVGERCHREILLLLAKEKFGAKIDKVFHSYPRALKKFLNKTRRSGQTSAEASSPP
jgi:uncharacterized protein YeaO (DUF488 family)